MDERENSRQFFRRNSKHLREVLHEVVKCDEIEAISFRNGVKVCEIADLPNIRPCLYKPIREPQNGAIVEPEMLGVLVHGHKLLRGNKLNEERAIAVVSHCKHF